MNDEILKELKDQTKWLKFLALPKLKEILESFLDSDLKRRIYNLSDGEKSSHQVVEELEKKGLKVSDQTVRNYWKNWSSIGIVVQSDKHEARYKKIINLDEIGIF